MRKGRNTRLRRQLNPLAALVQKTPSKIPTPGRGFQGAFLAFRNGMYFERRRWGGGGVISLPARNSY